MTFQQTWDNVARFWGGVSLDEPDVITDKSRAQREMHDQIAFIDMMERQIKVNYPVLCAELGKDKLKVTESHEVAHHKFCPYDLKTGFALTLEADKVLNNVDQAKYVENIFTDILCNTHIRNKGDKSIASVYKRMGQKDNGSNQFWNLYMRTYEKLWSLPKNSLAKKINEKIECDAEKLEDIVKKCIYKPDDWPKSMREFAKVVKDYVKNISKNGCKGNSSSQGGSKGSSQGNSQGSSGSQKNSQGGTAQTQPTCNPGQGNQQYKSKSPSDKGLIDEHSAKDFAPKNAQNDKAAEAEIEKKLKGSAKAAGYDPKRYTRVAAGIGLGNSTTALKWFYKDLASSFDVDLPEIISHSGSEVPETYIDWEVHDDERRLDIPFSLSQHGAVIPGYTTYQPKYKKGEFGQRNKTCPDLLVCVDSSGSMANPAQCLSAAVLSAMVAARKALALERRVAVINFSDRYQHQNYTIDQEKVDDAIVHYAGGGTLIPGAEILNTVKKNKNPQHILIISDTCIADLSNQLAYLQQAVQDAKSGGTIFLINPGAGSSKELEKIGYDVIRVTDPKDLIGLTLNKTKSIYGV
jgi:hypothetical protein